MGRAVREFGGLSHGLFTCWPSPRPARSNAANPVGAAVPNRDLSSYCQHTTTYSILHDTRLRAAAVPLGLVPAVQRGTALSAVATEGFRWTRPPLPSSSMRQTLHIPRQCVCHREDTACARRDGAAHPPTRSSRRRSARSRLYSSGVCPDLVTRPLSNTAVVDATSHGAATDAGPRVQGESMSCSGYQTTPASVAVPPCH
jgi:hypothetical protein